MHSRCAFAIPDALASQDAAPLLCAGVTVFAPLARYARSSARVGVMGVGGLGHLALQYARAMGCDVTAFSSSSSKKDEATRFGANEFVATENAAVWGERAGLYDLILTTAAGDLPWTDYLTILKPEGTLCVVGLPDHDVQIGAIPLLFGQRKVVGTLIGSTAESEAMLRFSARHGIKPQIEVRPMTDANAALDRLRKNEVRYRSVLTNQ